MTNKTVDLGGAAEKILDDAFNMGVDHGWNEAMSTAISLIRRAL